MIIVKPNGGLGNRMRVIHSAMLLARLRGQKKITVLWKKDDGLNAGFYQSFEPVPNVCIRQNLAVMGLQFYTFKNLPGFRFIDDNILMKHRFDKAFWLQGRKNFLINGCFDFLSHEEENLYAFFKPVSEIRRRVEKLKQSFSPFTVGVQIRRTDNIPAIVNSPVEWFVNEMNKAVQANSEATFFLCTDDPECENQMRSLFGNRILTQQDKSLSRNSVEGIESALVDMYGLASTRFILGSYQSSFGEVASYIGNSMFYYKSDMQIKF